MRNYFTPKTFFYIQYFLGLFPRLCSQLLDNRASMVAQTVNNPPKTQETWVRSRGWEDPLGKEVPTHSIFLPGESPWTEEPGRLQSMGLQKVGHD